MFKQSGLLMAFFLFLYMNLTFKYLIFLIKQQLQQYYDQLIKIFFIHTENE